MQTVPVPSGGDAADDPALWLHPFHPEQSLLLGTDKQGGLHVYNLDGSQRQLVGRGCHPNNVDVLCGFLLGGQVVFGLFFGLVQGAAGMGNTLVAARFQRAVVFPAR